MSVRCLLITGVLALMATAAGAQTLRYVSDELVVNLRTGQTNGHAILRVLAAGTALDVLEENEASGYSRVRLPDRDIEGWVLTQYLTPEPIARDKLALAERELTAARSRIAELETSLRALSEELDLAADELEQRDSAAAKLSGELADIRSASANAIALRDENETLKRRLDERNEEVRRLNERNATLASRERQNWFVTGASVLGAGIIMGLILPRMRRRRRTDW